MPDQTPMTDDVTDRTLAIIAAQAMMDPSELRLDATPEEIGLDSLALVEIVFAIEEAFDVTAPYNANEPAASGFDVSTVGRVVEAVKRLVAEQR